MNEKKFRELTDAAGFFRYDPFEKGSGPIDWYNNYNYDNELYRFAELIFGEILTVVDEIYQDRNYKLEDVIVLNSVHDKIMERMHPQ